MFRTKRIEVWNEVDKVDLGGGVFLPGETQFTYDDLVNIQPYSSTEARKDYGLDVDTTHTMFSDVDSRIEIGSTIIKYKGDDYDVIEKIVWDNHMEVLLNRR